MNINHNTSGKLDFKINSSKVCEIGFTIIYHEERLLLPDVMFE